MIDLSPISSSAATVAKADRLKIVSRHGVGYDAVHLASALRAGPATTVFEGDIDVPDLV